MEIEPSFQLYQSCVFPLDERSKNLERRAVIETAPEPWQGSTLPLRQHRSEIMLLSLYTKSPKSVFRYHRTAYR